MIKIWHPILKLYIIRISGVMYTEIWIINIIRILTNGCNRSPEPPPMQNWISKGSVGRTRIGGKSQSLPIAKFANDTISTSLMWVLKHCFFVRFPVEMYEFNPNCALGAFLTPFLRTWQSFNYGGLSPHLLNLIPPISIHCSKASASNLFDIWHPYVPLKSSWSNSMWRQHQPAKKVKRIPSQVC